jgi:hypothetical protein
VLTAIILATYNLNVIRKFNYPTKKSLLTVSDDCEVYILCMENINHSHQMGGYITTISEGEPKMCGFTK